MKKQQLKKKSNKRAILFLTFFITVIAAYIMRVFSGFFYADGIAYFLYTKNHLLMLLCGYTILSVILLPFLLKADLNGKEELYILPLMLFSAVGMMRIEIPPTSKAADMSPSIMFIILCAALVVMAFSGYSSAGAVGTIAGTLIYPAFGLCFSPFIAAAAFLFKGKNETEKRISVILNCILSLLAAIFSIIRLEAASPSFSKKYVLVFAAIIAAALFLYIKKDFRLLPVCILPLFPLTAGIFYNTFFTDLFTLAASIAPLVILLGTAALKGNNEKIKGYAQYLAHNPVCFVIIAVFILRTAASAFINPGFFREILP